MKGLRIAVTGLLLVSMAGCRKDNSKKSPENHSNPPASVEPDSMPVVEPGVHGSLVVGSVTWTLPKYLEGQFHVVDQKIAEAALDVDLVKEDVKKSVHVNTGIHVKACKPAEEAAAFFTYFGVPPSENVPDSHKTDMFEASSWSSETKSFKGRIYLQKRYKSQGDTGIYQMHALVANEKSSECAFWNFVFTPPPGTSAEFIEGSDAYRALMDSLVSTWEELGADFER